MSLTGLNWAFTRLGELNNYIAGYDMMFQNYLPHLWSMSTSQTLFVNQTFRRSFAVFKKPHKLNKSVQVKKIYFVNLIKICKNQLN